MRKTKDKITWDEIIEKVKKGEWRLIHIDQLSSEQLIELMITGETKLSKPQEKTS